MNNEEFTKLKTFDYPHLAAELNIISMCTGGAITLYLRDTIKRFTAEQANDAPIILLDALRRYNMSAPIVLDLTTQPPYE